MLILEELSVAYRSKKESRPVLCGLSLTLNEGEALAVLGASGCGKSTLINTLAGTVARDGGRVDYVKEGERKPLSPKTHKIGVIPQNCGLLPWKTVQENCLLPLKIRHEAVSAERDREIEAIYESLEISGLLCRYPGELSGGQAQRAAIARAFLMKPDLLLMDEPFSALDAITREEARELFLRVWERNRPTTILVTHSIEEALFLGNTVLVMGARSGTIQHRMENPYFGIPYPEDADYLRTRHFLREQLKPEKGRTAS